MKLVWGLLAVAMWIAAPTKAEDLPLVELKTPQGVTFTYFRTSVQNTVAIAVAFKGGLASDDVNAPATGLLAPNLITEGADGKSAAELFELFQDYGGQFSISANPDQIYAALSAPKKGIMGAAKLANLVLTKPDFPEKKLLQLRESYAQRLEEYAAYPESKIQEAFSDADTERHPYRSYFSPTPEAVRRVSTADLRPWAAKHFTKDGILVAMVGDLDPAEAQAAVDQLLDGLPEKTDLGPTPKMIFKTRPVKPISLSLRTGDQAMILMGATLPFNATLDEWMGSQMLSQIFVGDQKSRLFKDIRESTGATYGLQPSINFYEVAMMNGVSGRIAKTNSEATIGLVKKSWDQFRLKGPSDDEIANAKAAMGHYIGGLSRNHVAMAGFIRDYLTGHWTTEELAKLPTLIANVNLKDPANLARLFPENPIIVVAQ
jgi:zinc protease